MSFLTGKPQKQESKNLAYPFIQDNFGDSGAGAFNSGVSGLQSVLQGGPEQFFNQGGGKFLLNEGLDSLMGKYSAMGLRESGAAMKGMEQYRNNLASTYLNQYLGQLGDLSKLGLGAGGLVANAGQVSKGQGQTQGLGSLIGAALAFI